MEERNITVHVLEVETDEMIQGGQRSEARAET